MNYLDRYILAVKNYLPAKSREDVGEEIRTILQDKIDEAVETHHNKKNDEQILGILKKFGHPIQVASKYQPQKVLISEQLFPIYKEVLKYVLIGLAVLTILPLIWAAFSEGIGGIINLIILFCYEFVHMSLVCIAIITLFFHFMDDWISSKDFFSHWNPRNLPRAESHYLNIPLSDAFIDIMIAIALLAIINGGIPDYYYFLDNDNVTYHLSSDALRWLPFVNGLMIFYLALYAINLIQPFWTKLKIAINGILGIIALWMFSKLLFLEKIITFTANDNSQLLTSVDELVSKFNLGCKYFIGFILMIYFYEIVRDAYRLTRLRKE